MKQIFLSVFCVVFVAGCQTSGTAKSVPVAVTQVPIRNTGPTISGGGLVGGAFGELLTAKDRQIALNAEYKALEYSKVGEASNWTGAEAGVTGKVDAAQAYRVGSQDCRQYSHEIVSNGAKRVARGSACRNSDGSWTLLE